jgi:anti-sigma factor RsiW
MTDDDRTLSAEEAIDEQIVAYLDGELDRETATRVERQLADDPSYRARLARLQQAWDMLDTLGRTEADDSFTQSTMSMVSVKAEEQSQEDAARQRSRRALAWAGAGLAALAVAITSYAIVRYRLDEPNRELVRDFPVIERIDEYRNIDSVEFLQALQSEGLFAAEVDDGG